MTKKPVAIRMSDATREKLKTLKEKYGTQTEVMAVAIDRLYRALTKERGEADDK